MDLKFLLAFFDTMDTVAQLSARTRDERTHFHWAWIVAIGVLAIGAGVGMAICQQKGYAGFTGDIEFVRNAEGVKIGVKAGCY